MPRRARLMLLALSLVVALVVLVSGSAAPGFGKTALRVSAEGYSTSPQSSGTTASYAGSNPWFATYDGQNGYVYVVNSGGYAGSHNSSVSVIDGLQMIASVSAGDYPWFATVDQKNGLVYVENTNSSYVTVIQGAQFLTNIPVGRDPTDGTYDPGNGLVYVPNLESDNVSVLSGTQVIGSVAVASKPWSATYDPGDGDVYVSGIGSTLVSVINGTTLVGSIDVGGVPGYDGYATYDGGTGDLYLSNEGTQAVDVIHGLDLVASIPIGGTPTFPAYDPRNGFVYVGNLGPPCSGGGVCIVKDVANVTVIDGTELVQNVQVGAGPYFALYDPGNGYVYVSSYCGSVSVIDGTSPLSTLNPSGTPYFSTYDPTNGYVYVTNPDINGVNVLRGANLVGTVFGQSFRSTLPASSPASLEEVLALGVGGTAAAIAIGWWMRKTDRPPTS